MHKTNSKHLYIQSKQTVAVKKQQKMLYYIKNQQDATLAVLFISNCKITLHVSDAPRSVAYCTIVH